MATLKAPAIGLYEPLSLESTPRDPGRRGAGGATAPPVSFSGRPALAPAARPAGVCTFYGVTDNSMTAEELETLRAELEDLEGRGRAEIAEQIKVARGWGDLKEN